MADQKELQTQLISMLPEVTQPWSDAFYNALAPLVCLTAIEVMVFRQHTADPLQILLLERARGDAYYGGQEHSPGSMLRATDAGVYEDPRSLDAMLNGKMGANTFFEKPFARVRREIGVEEFSQTPVPVGAFPHKTPRGSELAFLFIAEIGEEPEKGSFHPVEEVLARPAMFNLIRHHMPVIARGLWAYHNIYPTLRHMKGWAF